jgi:hypothetical protein
LKRTLAHGAILPNPATQFESERWNSSIRSRHFEPGAQEIPELRSNSLLETLSRQRKTPT